jgi:hypothetical protein
VIKNPEITKNTSTPAKPPVRPGHAAWYKTTANTATPRTPSTSGLNAQPASRSGTAAGYDPPTDDNQPPRHGPQLHQPRHPVSVINLGAYGCRGP